MGFWLEAVAEEWLRFCFRYTVSHSGDGCFAGLFRLRLRVVVGSGTYSSSSGATFICVSLMSISSCRGLSVEYPPKCEMYRFGAVSSTVGGVNLFDTM